MEGSQLDSVALGDLSMKSVEPGVPARFELLADTPGAYPVVLVNEDRRIGTLESALGALDDSCTRTMSHEASTGVRKYGGER